MKSTAAAMALACALTAQATSGLTPAQDAAVWDSVDKLIQIAVGTIGSGWPPGDSRWGALEGLILETGPQDFAITNGVVGGRDSAACTVPKDGRMRPEDANDIRLEVSRWRGPSKDRFFDEDPMAACWVLAAVLLHEATHAIDDDYNWPPSTPHDNKMLACEEVLAHDAEINVLDEGAEALREDGFRDAAVRVGQRMGGVTRARNDWRGKKDGGDL